MKKKEDGCFLDGLHAKTNIMKKKKTIREKLIDTLIEYAGDEIESVTEAIGIAKKSDEELIDMLIDVLIFYHNEYNN
jgi:hypothetical protein